MSVPADDLPEQPISLTAPAARWPALVRSGVARVGEVLPARRAPLSLSLTVPRVPKRAIFAAGICAGLAAPSLARRLVGRGLAAAFGRRDRPALSQTNWQSATLEIIRVTYAGPGRRRSGSVWLVPDRLARLFGWLRD